VKIIFHVLDDNLSNFNIFNYLTALIFSDFAFDKISMMFIEILMYAG